MAKVLVTGGCGFVGVPTVARLVEVGHDVVVVDNLSRGSAEALSRRVDVRLVEANLADRDQLEQLFAGGAFEAVVHLAAMHFIPDCNRDPESCLAVNVAGTQQLATMATRTETVRAFVFASTAAVYQPSDEPHRESSSLGPTDVYGASKLAAEQLLRQVAEARITLGVARLFNVFGPGETNPHLIPAVIEQAMTGDELQLGNLETKRDYVFTDDVASGFATLLRATLDGQAGLYNLGSGRAYSGHEVVEAAGRALGKELRVVHDPSRMRVSDRPNLSAEIGLAEARLGWSPKVSLEEGLEACIGYPRQ